MKIYLLTHEREINRKTNTGSIAIEAANGLVERILWDRVNPSKKLLELIESNSALLLYPSKDSNQSSIKNFENVIILDATWQEAQKMYNKSPYLKDSSKAALSSKKPSQYNLRRNQTRRGLCTIECVIEILKLKGKVQLAEELSLSFKSFNNPNTIRQ
jgi:DTW domain-containing protein YfiP